MINSPSLLLQLAEVLEAPRLPWPLTYPYIFLRKRPEKIAAAQEVAMHMWPDSIRRSIPSRRYEYMLGRLAAATVLELLDVPLGDRWVKQEGRRPVWPQGITGAISHTHDLLVVTAGRRSNSVHAVGIDVEYLSQDHATIEALRMGFGAEEIRRLEAVEYGLITGFSVKEALFKCLSEEVGRYFDFLDAEIVGMDPVRQKIQLQLLTKLSPRLPCGTNLYADYCLHESHVWTGIVWGGSQGSH